MNAKSTEQLVSTRSHVRAEELTWKTVVAGGIVGRGARDNKEVRVHNSTRLSDEFDTFTSLSPAIAQLHDNDLSLIVDRRISWRLMSLDEETTMVAGNVGRDIADIERVTITSTGTMPDLSELTAPSTAVYQRYDFNHTPDKSLPIFPERERILDTIESNMVTVIQGPTGCGKSTQVPQYILDSCASRGAPCNIIITQPRRIAAITVARRVSNERDWPLPSVVGYHVGLNNQTSEDTRLTFCTTGVLVQKMINKKTLEGYTHIILDEVHERDMDMDFAILIVRKLCFTTSRHIKVILMSATFNVTKFADYFTVSDSKRKVHMPVPVIDLDKSKSKNRIINYYLDQLGVLGPVSGEGQSPWPCLVSYLVSCLVSYLRPCLVSYLRPCLVSYLRPCLVSYSRPCLVSYSRPCLVSYLVSCLESYLRPCLASYLRPCLASYLRPCLVSYLRPCLVSSQLPDIETKDPRIKPESYSVAVKLIQEFDQLERQARAKKGAVLVFLPGIREIEELFNMLTEKERASGTKQGSSLTLTDYTMALSYKLHHSGTKQGSSLTLTDYTMALCYKLHHSGNKEVIDFCLTKHLVCDPKTNFTSLQLSWASKTNCIQRAGRSGRVAEGRVYRLVPEIFYENVLIEDCLPEIQRAPLEQVVLQTKILDMGPPKNILGLALDPPNLDNIEQTILVLKEAGGLLLDREDAPDPEDGYITFLGRVMARLPLDIRISRMIVLGYIFSCLDECIIMGAAMSLKNMFSCPFLQRMNAYISKLTWADGSCSDMFCFLNAYKVYEEAHRTGRFKRSVNLGERNWANCFFIQLNTMKDLKSLVDELKTRLKNLGIEEILGHDRVHWAEEELPLVLKVVIAGAYYPNYFVRGASGGQIDEQEAVKQVMGRDPYSTVYLSNFPMNQPGELYAQSIKRVLNVCAPKMQVFFDGSSKVYVQFPRVIKEDGDDRKMFAAIPGKVSLSVYKAVKLRQMNTRLAIYLLTPSEAERRAKMLGLVDKRERMLSMVAMAKVPRSPTEEGAETPSKDELIKRALKPMLPGIRDSFIAITISNPIDPGHFWAQYSEERGSLQRIMNSLNAQNVRSLVPLSGRPRVGQLLAAPYTDSDHTILYYRARVDSITLTPRGNSVEVFFIDYGNIEHVKESALRDFDQSLFDDGEFGIMGIPAQAMECVLCEIRPSLMANPRGHWTQRAINDFEKMVSNKSFYGKVNLRGPYSPLEMRIYGQTLVGEERDLFIDPNSVNSVLLDTDPQDPHERQTPTRGNIVLSCSVLLRQTPTRGNILLSCPVLLRQTPTRGNIVLSCPVLLRQTPTRGNIVLSCSVLLRQTPTRDRPPLETPTRGNIMSCLVLPAHTHTIFTVGSVFVLCVERRLLVAATVEENSSSTGLILRNTTLMPNIHGFPALMALLFAPRAEIRVNDTRTKYIGALCGLGYDIDTDMPLFPEHDMEVRFDVEINIQDLQDINMLRFWMSNATSLDEGETALIGNSINIVNCQHKIRGFLNTLLHRKRKSQELSSGKKQYAWNLVEPELLMHPGIGVSDEAKSMFKLHWAVALNDEDTGLTEELRTHVQELQELAAGSVPVKEAKCRLCQVVVSSAQSLRLHLISAQHRDREDTLKKGHGQTPG
uniref:Probable ATP-dependent RNA helicase spindle-E n=1 Tax=Timema douglasi TaxID=61478 RepID=A0A7R8VP59_TIMDO|nr:unnamed protein product [Timema douglasi]